jgi:hypothetical protein
MYNEEYAFLMDYKAPPDGWRKVPQGDQRGTKWEGVPDDTFQGQPYYRQHLPADGPTPQNFTVWVGDRYVTSMMTAEWSKITLANMFRDMMPGLLKDVFPYSIATNLTMGGDDQYLALLSHESAHSYQGMKAPDKLAQSELGFSDYMKRYPWDDPAWQAELDTLHRMAASIPQELVNFERSREWEEGLGKYAELSIYRLAATTPGYQPAPEYANLPEYQGYRGFQRFWDNQINQISLSRSNEDIRFYYSGFAQAVLLDRLMPGWKSRLFESNVWLEDLLAEAVAD